MKNYLNRSNYFLSLYLGSLMGTFGSWLRSVVCDGVWRSLGFRRKREVGEMPRHEALGGIILPVLDMMLLPKMLLGRKGG